MNNSTSVLSNYSTIDAQTDAKLHALVASTTALRTARNNWPSQNVVSLLDDGARASAEGQTRGGGYQNSNRLAAANEMTAKETHLLNEADATNHFGGEINYAEVAAGRDMAKQVLRCISYHHVETGILDLNSNFAKDSSNPEARSKPSTLRRQNQEHTQGNELINSTSMEQDADYVVVKVSSIYTIDQSEQGRDSNAVELTNHVDYEWGPASDADILLKMIDIKINRDGVRTESVRPIMHIDASQLKRYFPSPY